MLEQLIDSCHQVHNSLQLPSRFGPLRSERSDRITGISLDDSQLFNRDTNVMAPHHALTIAEILSIILSILRIYSPRMGKTLAAGLESLDRTYSQQFLQNLHGSWARRSIAHDVCHRPALSIDSRDASHL